MSQRWQVGIGRVALREWRASGERGVRMMDLEAGMTELEVEVKRADWKGRGG